MLVRFTGSLQPGVTLRDVVNVIPWVAIQKGLLTVAKAGKINVFSGRILEIEGLPDLKLDQAFELTDASAERSCAGCTIKLSEATVAEYLRSNVALLKNMIARGYNDARTMARRLQAMEAWLADPQLLSADADAEYAEVIEINLDELTDATAERSCAGSTIKLSVETVSEYLRSNVALMKNMIARGYSDARTLARRIKAMQAWLDNPVLMEADADAEYAAVIEIDLDQLSEPILACPNDPDNVKLLSDVAGERIDEVFIGSCMTNIGHYRAAATVLEGQGANQARLWVCPPTRMDEEKLKEEGYYSIFEAAGSRMEMPGCSLCMGNQARVEDNTSVFSTSTRNFNNRLGNGAQVYLGSAELAAVCAQLGRIPTKQQYLAIAAAKIDPNGEQLYRYLNFDQIEGFEEQGRVVSAEAEAQVLAGV